MLGRKDRDGFGVTYGSDIRGAAFFIAVQHIRLDRRRSPR